MIVVCDASPLIMLAKLNRLSVLSALLGDDIVVLDCVVRELLSDRAGPVEMERLQTFLKGTQTPFFQGRVVTSQALSGSDQSSLAWAIEHHATWLVADDRLLRRIAKEHGIAVVGFCGLLAQSARIGILAPHEVQKDIDEAITRHGLRISVRLYREILSSLGN